MVAEGPAATDSQGVASWLATGVLQYPADLYLSVSEFVFLKAVLPVLTRFVKDEVTIDYYNGLFPAILMAVIAVTITLAFALRNYGGPKAKVKAVKEFVAPGEGPRFRKRDRLAFMGKKAMRSAKDVGSYIRGGQGRKRRDMARVFKKVFQRSDVDPASALVQPDLPEEFLEEDGISDPGIEGQPGVPEALKFVLKNLRVFGQFENAILLEVMKNIENIHLRQNDKLFRVGDPDDSMYIVETGAIQVYYDLADVKDAAKDSGPTAEPSSSSSAAAATAKQFKLKTVGPGDPIISLLSFLDYLAGKRKVYKTVSAKATKETKLIRVSFEHFKNAFDSNPESLTRVVRVVMVRLQRVTFLALHQYLGLGAELLNHQHRGTVGLKKQVSTGAEAANAPLKRAGSPVPIPESGNGASSAAAQRASLLAPQESVSGTSVECDSFIKSSFQSKKRIAGMNDEKLREFAAEAFKHLLGITDEDMIRQGECFENHEELLLNDIELLDLEEQQILVEEETTDNFKLYLVIQGCVKVSQKDVDNVSHEIQRAYPGGLLGQLRVLTSEPNFFTYSAITQCRVASISGSLLESLMSTMPHVALQLAMSVMSNLSPYVRSIDFSLEWNLVETGKALYKQDSPADSTYVVLSGRLRSVFVREGSTKKEMVGEFGRGELTGIVETLMKTPRSTTVLAVRDTEVAKLPAGLIDFIKMRFPNVLMRLIKLLGEKLQQSWEKGSDPRGMMLGAGQGQGGQGHMTTSTSSFSTIAIFGLSPEIPVTSFTLELLHCLNQIDPALRLTQDYIRQVLGPDAFEKSSDIRLSAWLAHQEDTHRMVIYQCERELNSWTKLSIRHADVILLLADPNSPHTVTPFEEQLEAYSKRTRKELVFLHKPEVKYPKDTSLWRRARSWISMHYHVRSSQRMFFKKLSSRVEEMYRKIEQSSSAPDIHSDFSRLARMLTGTSVGLVLGGGGARGCSHVGMIKAILEAGIPIDMVAGVSIGSFIGGLYCQERNVPEMTVKARSFSFKMTQWWRQIMDLTYPYTSYFSGAGFNRLIQEIFEERDIHDLWLPYFTITTDITNSAMRQHDYGSLWRYVRSSMSLAGYMPPLCDPHDGHLLLDGGYVNNLPADLMRMRGAMHILAIDVGAQDDVNFTNYGDSLSGFKVLLNRWNPFRSTVMNVPNQADVQSRLAYVSCVGKLETVKKSDYCDYIRPPIDRYGTLQFGSFDEIRDVGYYHGKTYFTGLRKAGLLKHFLERPNKDDRSPVDSTPVHHRGFNLQGMMRRGSVENLYSSSVESNASFGGRQIGSNNFSNLAEMVCNVRDAFPTSGPVSRGRSKSDPAGQTLLDGERSDEDDLSLTDEDSDNLISDEENDTESGFLSQM